MGGFCASGKTLEEKLFFVLDNWHQPRGRNKKVAVILIIFLFLAVSLFVYLTGGIQYSYFHSMYIPIIMGALLFQIKGGAI